MYVFSLGFALKIVKRRLSFWNCWVWIKTIFGIMYIYLSREVNNMDRLWYEVDRLDMTLYTGLFIIEATIYIWGRLQLQSKAYVSKL